MKKIKASLNDDNVQFFCNPKKGVVVCKIESCVVLPHIQDGFFYGKKVKVKGMAICGKDDKYDEIKGRQIAESRAKVALYRELREVIIKLKTRFFNEEMDLMNQKSRYERLIAKEKLHIEELTQ